MGGTRARCTHVPLGVPRARCTYGHTPTGTHTHPLHPEAYTHRVHYTGPCFWSSTLFLAKYTVSPAKNAEFLSKNGCIPDPNAPKWLYWDPPWQTHAPTVADQWAVVHQPRVKHWYHERYVMDARLNHYLCHHAHGEPFGATL